MNLNFYIFIFGTFMFFAFALRLLFTKYGNTYLNKLLAIIALHRAIQLVYFILIRTDQIFIIENLFSYLDVIHAAYPACAYLYIRGFIYDENKLPPKEWFHFIPALLILFNSITSFLLGTSGSVYLLSKINAIPLFSTNANYDFISDSVEHTGQGVLIFIYLFLIWRAVLKSQIIRNRRDNLIANNWILLIVAITTVTNSVFLVSKVIRISNGPAQSGYFLTNYGAILFSILVLLMIIFLFCNPRILYGHVFVNREYVNIIKEKEVTAKIAETSSTPISLKSAKNGISLSLIKNEQRYLEEITTYMETKKPFLNCDFSIGMLSQAIDVPDHHCSYIINHVIGTTFRDWANAYRVAYFIENYPANSKTKTILALSIESGFKNKNTFYAAFKKQMGVLPTNYFENNCS